MSSKGFRLSATEIRLAWEGAGAGGMVPDMDNLGKGTGQDWGSGL